MRWGDDSRAGGASGRFVLRLDPALHETLRREAPRCGLSLNDYCARRLAAPGADCDARDAAAALRRAASMFEDHLLGVVLFGSYARGEAGTASDVDLLVVVEPEPRSTSVSPSRGAADPTGLPQP